MGSPLFLWAPLQLCPALGVVLSCSLGHSRGRELRSFFVVPDTYRDRHRHYIRAAMPVHRLRCASVLL